MTTYQLLLYGAICKDKGNGHRFYDALRTAGAFDLHRARSRLNRYRRYPDSHEAKRLRAIEARLDELAAQKAVSP